MNPPSRPITLRELRESGWQSKSIKREIREIFYACWLPAKNCFRE